MSFGFPPVFGFGLGALVESFGLTDENNPATTDYYFEPAYGTGLALGQPCFLRKTINDEPVQYLGAITKLYTTAAGKTAIHCSHMPGEWINGAAWQIMTPATWITFAIGPGADINPAMDLGLDVVATRGGAVWRTRIGNSLESVTFNWSGRLRGDYHKFLAFIKGQRDGGLKPFTAAWWERSTGSKRVAIVGLSDKTLGASSAGRFTEDWSVTLYIEEDGAYQYE